MDVRVAACAAALLAVMSAGCASTSVVHLRDFAFAPDTLEVAAGTTVQFTSDGSETHSVTIHDPSFRTVLDRDLEHGDSVSYTFASPGKYHVFCRHHEGMTLTVTVT